MMKAVIVALALLLIGAAVTATLLARPDEDQSTAESRSCPGASASEARTYWLGERVTINGAVYSEIRSGAGGGLTYSRPGTPGAGGHLIQVRTYSTESWATGGNDLFNEPPFRGYERTTVAVGRHNGELVIAPLRDGALWLLAVRFDDAVVTIISTAFSTATPGSFTLDTAGLISMATRLEACAE